MGRALQAQGTARAMRVAERIARFLAVVSQVIDQAEWRVLHGEMAPAEAKLVSLFEPHTQVIRRAKPGKMVAFGRKLILDEVEGSSISGFAIAERPGQDQPYLKARLAGHRRRFGRSPTLLAGDRGFASAENERLAREAGVRRIVPPAGRRRTSGRRNGSAGSGEGSGSAPGSQGG